jgi:hypothetical protein
VEDRRSRLTWKGKSENCRSEYPASIEAFAIVVIKSGNAMLVHKKKDLLQR